MKQKPLIEANPYLRDPEKFRKALILSVACSSACATAPCQGEIPQGTDLERR